MKIFIVSARGSYNKQYIGKIATKKDFAFSVLAKDKKKTLVGGINTVAFWGWLHIERLWLEEKSRGTGLGKQLLLKAEEFAIKNGVSKSRLETTDFQAKGFYLKQGYKVYGVLADRNIFLSDQVNKNGVKSLFDSCWIKTKQETCWLAGKLSDYMLLLKLCFTTAISALLFFYCFQRTLMLAT